MWTFHNDNVHKATAKIKDPDVRDPTLRKVQHLRDLRLQCLPSHRDFYFHDIDYSTLSTMVLQNWILQY